MLSHRSSSQKPVNMERKQDITPSFQPTQACRARCNMNPSCWPLTAQIHAQRAACSCREVCTTAITCHTDKTDCGFDSHGKLLGCTLRQRSKGRGSSLSLARAKCMWVRVHTDTSSILQNRQAQAEVRTGHLPELVFEELCGGATVGRVLLHALGHQVLHVLHRPPTPPRVTTTTHSWCDAELS